MFDLRRILFPRHFSGAHARTQSYLPVEARFAQPRGVASRFLVFAGGALGVAERKYPADYFHRFLQLQSVRERSERIFRLYCTSRLKKLAAADHNDARKALFRDDHIVEALVVLGRDIV